MYDQSFDEMARECGLNAEEYGGNIPSGYATQPHIQSYNYMADFNSEDIELSSPCPPGRGIRRSAYQLPSIQDPITEYYEDDQQLHYANESYTNQLFLQSQLVPASYSSRAFRSSHGAQEEALPEERFEDEYEYEQSEARAVCNPPSGSTSTRESSDRDQFAEQRRMQAINMPRNAHGIRLRPVSELPDIYRSMWKFGVFNAIQSSCFDDIMASEENLVISAPTGSGKTVLFELAVIHMLMQSGNDGSTKCVYMAPTKALCSERYRDWTVKFEGLGIKCCELTGDTVQFGKSAWGEARDATIMYVESSVETIDFPVEFMIYIALLRVKNGTVLRDIGASLNPPSLHPCMYALGNFRKDNGQVLYQVQLFLVDEVHILNESRGSTLEVVISRMKTRGTSVRFVMVSATVPNIEDIAGWVGSRDKSGSAKVFQFDEEFRPCKLTKHVYGVARHRNQNEYQYSSTLDKKLFPILQQHSVNKPILVFVSTRKGVLTTAEHLACEYEQAAKVKQSLPWSQPRNVTKQFHDKRLEKLATLGIGVHHAGLSMDDRRVTEELYSAKILRLLVATSTLAVGVNLPAHTVVIRGVKMYQPDGYKEYSDLDVMQMMGRAGRPQFDKDGIAIVLCEPELEAKYRNLVQGKTVLESCLHRNLSEHLNSEIGLGTISDIRTAKEWLHNSFLFQRLRRNPAHYAFGKPTGQSWQERLNDMVMQGVKTLKDSELVEYEEESENGSLRSTEYGDIMSKLEAIAAADEFSDLKLRSGEKKVYKHILDHQDIRYKIKKVDKPADKVFILLQAVLGGIALNSPEYRTSESQPPLDAIGVFRHVGRIARVVVEVALVKKQGAKIKHGLELLRCFTAKAWEDRPVVLRQVEQIGDKSIKVLAEHGITSLDALRRQDPLRIETLLNRRPPFGHEVLASLVEVPQYFLDISERGIESIGGRGPVCVELSIECGLISDRTTHISKPKKNKSRRGDMTAILTLTSDFDFIDFRRISTKALAISKSFVVTAELTKPSQSISVYIASENIAGATLSKTHKPQVSPKEFPVVNTRPLNSLEAELEGLEDDPHFWDITFEDEEVVKDLTKPHDEGTKSQRQSKIEKTTSNANSSVLETLDFKPKKLENGNYECNHTCKDKTKCRHFWLFAAVCSSWIVAYQLAHSCRQGVAKPPPPPKRLARQDTAADKDAHKPQLNASTEEVFVQICKAEDVEKLKQKKRQGSDFRLQQLEKLHERTDVANSLGLSEGRRLKLEDSSSIKRSKPKPNFDLQFANLDDEDKAREMPADPDDSEDELPDPKELVHETRAPASKPRSSSEIDISDDLELDAAILQMPSDEARTGKKATSLMRPGSFSRKRERDLSPPTPVKKHRGVVSALERLPEQPQAVSPKTQRIKSPAGKREPLFMPSSPNEFDTCYYDDITVDAEPEQEEFTLDESLFDIVPSTNTTLTFASASSTLDGDSSSKVGDSSTNGPVVKEPRASTSGNCSGNQQAEKLESAIAWPPEDEDNHDNGLAEFEAWLASGAVELIP
ncbi:P-loop containing nucleoside triphosphate hydrolase protein [Neolentinus lepideus HHB14362 ss-1]|uniref:DNA 3'-5' helicase n=1 Tax=Neolentinus lepideus HHB14362 ss-1 TaxID=1314782 RepID=A0A165TXW8_9AGAM|nr:P-loop containing nucleoside triphosphate hydrolase protein [Neolentinus lepideus HHB14362 ss-1]